jgi:hypothetical protein
VLIIQVVAALLLLLGSGLIFRALLEIDAPTRQSMSLRARPRPAARKSDVDLPRAA